MDIFREVKSELSKLLDTERYPKLSEEEKLAAMVEKSVFKNPDMLREGVVLYSGGKVKGSHGHIVLTKINDEGENPCDFIQEKIFVFASRANGIPLTSNDETTQVLEKAIHADEIKSKLNMTDGEFLNHWFDSKMDLFGSSAVTPSRICATVFYLQPIYTSVDEIFKTINQ